MGKFVLDASLKVKSNYILHFKNLNFNLLLSSKIKFIKKIHVLQNLFINAGDLVNILDNNNTFPFLAIYINLTTKSSLYYYLKTYLELNFFKILYTSHNILTKFKPFFLVYCVHSNVFYFDNFIKNVFGLLLPSPQTYFFIFIN
jgi:hypothetical protein